VQWWIWGGSLGKKEKMQKEKKPAGQAKKTAPPLPLPLRSGFATGTMYVLDIVH